MTFFRDRALQLQKEQKKFRGPKPKTRVVQGPDGTAASCIPWAESFSDRWRGRGNLLTRLRRELPAHWGDRRAVCKKCRMELDDYEPAARHPHYWHRAHPTCPLSRGRVEIEDAIPFALKKYRRARASGARRAAKFRPR